MPSLAAPSPKTPVRVSATPMSGRARDGAIVAAGNVRFSVLTDRLIRMEWAADGAFEDRPSLAFMNRDTQTPAFESSVEGDIVAIDTGMVRLRCDVSKCANGFTPEGLTAEIKVGGAWVSWKAGDEDTGNLRGTCRTLDGVSGSCPLEPGLLSRDGWVVWDDSGTPVLDESGWAQTRAGDDALADWYLFGYGRAYLECIRDFTLVSGKVPIPPRYVLGSWWSRYWPYTDEDLRTIVREFDEHDVPLDVLVIDMDWHLDGWTGYTWNPAYFEDPDAFLKWCRESGLRTTLNLHPADGVGKHEAAFDDVARDMGLDPAQTERVEFDCVDHTYMKSYFERLHHPLEKQGIDFWWMDWQQGTKTDVAGLDPLPWLNHLHWQDMVESAGEAGGHRAGLRPLVFSRWGGLGGHRYPIGFSGDTYNDWESLAFQPEFTATAGNVLFGWWSHDIGGHQPGPVEPELYARWVQFGVFSPILRTHMGRHPRAERKLWKFTKDVFEVTRDAFTLRYALWPYIYTAARQMHDRGVPICRPMYYQWSESDAAYDATDQYMFGDHLLVAPVTTPSDSTSGCSVVRVWLPEGEWVEWCSGRRLKSEGTEGRWVQVHAAMDEIPIFARSGAMIPMAPPTDRLGNQTLDPLVVEVFPGGDDNVERTYKVYLDDGISDAYTRGGFAIMPMTHGRRGRTHRITLGPVHGTYQGMEIDRACEIRLRDVWPPERVTLANGEIPARSGEAMTGWWYDEETMSVVIRLPRRSAMERIEIDIELQDLDELPLRQGLRGRLRVFDDVERLLGSHTPRAIRDALAWRGNVSERVEDAERIADDWWQYAIAIRDCDADQGARDRALARLLGVSARTELTGEGEDTLRAITDVVIAPRRRAGDGVDDVEVQVRVTPTGDWDPIHEPSETLGRIGGGIREHVESAWRVRDAVQSTSVRTEVVCKHGDETITLGFEDTFLPSIGAWWLIGPFECPFEEQMQPVFAPEEGVDLTGGVADAKGRALSWRRVARSPESGERLDGEFWVDLIEHFGQHEDCMCYAYAELESDAARDAFLAIGSDDGVVAWVNGVEVHRHHIERAYNAREDVVPISLKEGRNMLLLKIGQRAGGWSFAAHVQDDCGEPIPGVRVLPGVPSGG
ncbi:MAG: TIM-barrel domain-containing protein [Planctomycetota bacterium]